MSLRKKLMEWFKFYLLALSITSAVIVLGTLFYATLMNKPFLGVLRWALIVGVIVLVGIGFASLLPLSEYSYIAPYGRGRAGVNPVVMREGARHVKREREPRKRGTILGIVGLTLLLVYFLIFP